MIIVFEGNDKVGKSTLAKALSEEIGFPIVRVFKDESIVKLSNEVARIGKMNDAFEDIVIMEMINQTGIDVILDRSLPSADCYRRLRKEEPVDIKLISWWFNCLRKNQGFYIWVTASNEFATKAFKKNKEKKRYTKIEYMRLEQYFQWYHGMCNKNHCKHKTIHNRFSKLNFNSNIMRSFIITNVINDLKEWIGKD